MRATKFAFVVLVVSLGVTLSFGKEHGSTKKKALKNRSELVSNETAIEDSSAPSLAVEKDGEQTKEAEKTKSEVSAESSEGIEAQSTSPEVEEDTTVAVTVSKPSYLTKVQNLLRRVLDLLGLSRQKRKNRKMKYQQDSFNEQPYVEEVRATVGALMGNRECWKRAACGAGSYLRSVKGKEVLIVLLEKFAPTSWSESINHIKEAAIYKDSCDYRCLDE